ncbi:hypothetical protein CYLTODRAFT_495469 [Cylindrobasidium torrendii FP15055 ss-10]|uniref:Uncharacterized protein n=1 Tax=Cylindrobasidium torrendii FP15055 ss-10 TaxID=1314674 RepID=A0A0D7AUF4_9AGAR|nr:hypothetical protein CYLTODRAFT_495469 [Cylindrobasidium torrendii FP15055 ss-10]
MDSHRPTTPDDTDDSSSEWLSSTGSQATNSPPSSYIADSSDSEWDSDSTEDGEPTLPTSGPEWFRSLDPLAYDWPAESLSRPIRNRACTKLVLEMLLNRRSPLVGVAGTFEYSYDLVALWTDETGPSKHPYDSWYLWDDKLHLREWEEDAVGLYIAIHCLEEARGFFRDILRFGDDSGQRLCTLAMLAWEPKWVWTIWHAVNNPRSNAGSWLFSALHALVRPLDWEEVEPDVLFKLRQIEIADIMARKMGRLVSAGALSVS